MFNSKNDIMKLFDNALAQLKEFGQIRTEIYYHFSENVDCEIHRNMKTFNEAYDYCMRSQDAELICEHPNYF